MITLRLIWKTLAGLARELSDQAAYDRYLAEHQCKTSAEAWRTFIDDRHRRKYANAKCC